MIAKPGITTTQAMREAGYKESTVDAPSNITKSVGFRELLEEYGLTDGLIVKSLVEDIKKKPQKRKAELELAAKIKGMLKPPQHPLLRGSGKITFEWET